MQSTTRQSQVIIALYGLPGCGKSHALDEIRDNFANLFDTYEGSSLINDVTPGGIEAFKNMTKHEKTNYREKAIKTVTKACNPTHRDAVVSGHLMFWDENEDAGDFVYTEEDLRTFTHIVYLDVPAYDVAQRRRRDKTRARPNISIDRLSEWQEVEKSKLRSLCLQSGILYIEIPDSYLLYSQNGQLLTDFWKHSEHVNLNRAIEDLDTAVARTQGIPETFLVLDADKTLAAEDAGTLFWDRALPYRSSKNDHRKPEQIFDTLGYSYAAFRQVMLLYEQSLIYHPFDTLCQEVASMIKIHPELKSLLHLAAGTGRIGAVIVTSGIRTVWEKVPAQEGLDASVKVIGGNQVTHGYVVTRSVKSAVVERLQGTYHTYVWAFGDSPLDVDMLHKADQAIVVVGPKETRSKTMHGALREAIFDNGLEARQIVLPKGTSPRDLANLPLVDILDPEIILAIFKHRRQHHRFYHATDTNAARLLKSPARDATVAGVQLREAHSRIGHYLAVEFLTRIIGLEDYSMTHVQGHGVSGCRLRWEERTLIVALMRGGEAMALGVNEAFPRAMFLHAKEPKDILKPHVSAASTVLLVDSVINTGESMTQFVKHLRTFDGNPEIVVVTGVIQQNTVSEHLQELMDRGKCSVVALRVSTNKFKGQGGTDTGNRLFNTTHL